MINNADTEGAPVAAAEPRKDWRPSLKPTYHAGASTPQSQGSIKEIPDADGIRGVIRDWFKRPFVRIILGLGAFIMAAIVYDATVNFGSWTIRAEKPKASEHKGGDRPALTPGGESR